MKREAPKCIVVLTGICLVVAALLAGVNHITAPIIEKSAVSGAQASLYAVLPNAAGFEEETLEGEVPGTVTGVFRDTSGSGYAVTLSAVSSYSATPMTFTLGVGTDGKITGIEMTNYAESKDFGNYPDTYIGQDSALSGVDVHAGVTYSSKAFRGAVEDAFAVLVELGGVAQGNKTDEQIIEELKGELLPGALNQAGAPKLKEISLSDSAVQQALQAENDVGYFYVVEEDGETLVVAVSTTGGAVCMDLEKTDVTEQHAALIQRALEWSDPYGYRTPMKLIFALDSTGAVSGLRVSGELIQDSDYYSNYTLDESAYIAGIIGLTSETADQDATLISGATMTAGGVWAAMQDVFAAFDSLTAE